MQEVFAGFTEHADAQIGRVVAFLREQGKLDDTLLLVFSDNGASGEGGLMGPSTNTATFLGLPESLEDNLAAIEELGGPWTHNHYPSGWAQAGNTPLKFFKKYTFGGGVRAPLVLHWPRRLQQPGAVRSQFHHVIDIVPTLLELAGIQAPSVHRGVEQLPVHGLSMAYTLNDAAASTRRNTQYFEMGGQRGIWHKGWKAVTNHASGTPYDADCWELYDLSTDYAECRDLAAQQPERLQDLVECWWTEAARYGVLPLNDRTQARAAVRDPRAEARRHFVLLPGTRLLTAVSGPSFAGRSFQISARTHRDDPGTDGVLLAHGRRAAGFSLFVQNNRLVFDYNLAGSHSIATSMDELALGEHVLGCALVADGEETWIRLCADGCQIGAMRLARSFPEGFGVFSTQCGFNGPSSVSALYEAPFRLSGLLHSVEIELDPPSEDQGSAAWDAALRSQ